MARFGGGTAGEQLADGGRRPAGQIVVLFDAALVGALAPGGPQVGVCQACRFGFLERGLLDQQALALVAAPRTAEADHHGRKSAVLPGAPGECGIPAGQIGEMIEIGAPQAMRAPAFHGKQVALPQLLAALGTLGVAEDGEDHQVLGLRTEFGLRLPALHDFNLPQV